jgi:hypothetical protein
MHSIKPLLNALHFVHLGQTQYEKHQFDQKYYYQHEKYVSCIFHKVRSSFIVLHLVRRLVFTF